MMEMAIEFLLVLIEKQATAVRNSLICVSPLDRRTPRDPDREIRRQVVVAEVLEDLPKQARLAYSCAEMLMVVDS